MPASVSAKNLGDPNVEKEFSAFVAGHFKDIQGTYTVTLIGEPQSTIWELTVRSSDETLSAVKKFYGETPEHARLKEMTDYVELLTRAFPRARGANNA